MGKKDLAGVVVTVGGEVMPTTVGQRADDAHPGEVIAGQPIAEPEGGWPADEFTGKGGNFVRDPFTGVRSRVAPAGDVVGG